MAIAELDDRFEVAALTDDRGDDGVTLLISAMNRAVRVALAAGVNPTTVDVSVSYARPEPDEGRLLRAEGTLSHLGRRTAIAEGRLYDRRDRLIATSRSTYRITADRSR